MKLFDGIRKLYFKVIYGNDPELIYHPNHKTHVMLNTEALVGGIGVTLIQGTFQSGFLIQMGAADTALAFVSVLATVTGVIAPLAGLIYRRMPKHRTLILTTLLIARLLLASIVFVPLVLPKEDPACVPVMIAFITAAGILSCVGNVGYEMWMAAAVPPEIRGRYTASRNIMSNAVIPFCSLAAALFLDSMQQRYGAFLIIFSLGAALVIAEACMIGRIPETAYPVSERRGLDLRSALKQLGKARPYLRFVLNIFIFYLLLFIAASFHSVYLMKYHGFSYTMMTVCSIFTTLLQILQYRMWGKLCDRIGPGRLMYISLCLFVVELSVWMLVPVHLVKYLFFLFFIVTSASNSSLGIAVFARKFQLMPRENQSLYVGLYTAVVALAVFLGPAIGSAVKDFAELHMTAGQMDGMWNIRILYVIAFSTSLLHRLLLLLIRRKPEL